MSFPNDVAEKSLVATRRCCVLCHDFCGSKIELHHIRQKADGGEDTFENCIPLCFNCHAEVKAYNTNHPKGRKFSENELIQHRDKWYAGIERTETINDSQYIELDRETFRQLRKLLPSDVVMVLRNSDKNEYPFIIHILEDFALQCLKPEYEFIDLELEKMKKELAGDIRLLVPGFFTNVAAAIGIPKKVDEDTLKARFDAVFEYGRDIWWKYDEFIRIGRRKLGVQ